MLRKILLSKKITTILIILITIYLIFILISKLNIHKSVRNKPKTYKVVKYILQWTPRKTRPFDAMGEGNSAFLKNDCQYTNCLVTEIRDYLPNITQFDAVVFHVRDLLKTQLRVPESRSPEQKYIFAGMESSDLFPICDDSFDGFFNWTWTYKLDSDFHWKYVTIYDLAGNMVGPAIDMEWPTELNPTSDELKVKLSSKSKVAAWFISNCPSKSGREDFMVNVINELKTFGLEVDIFGNCGTFNCPKSEKLKCLEMIERDYFFYFSLENSFSEDYVTEKLLIALNNYAIPIVYGVANYSRFLPPGSYLNGWEIGPRNLAIQISEILYNKTLYYDYFRWTNHYAYRDTSRDEDICKLCAMMNDEDKFTDISVWDDFLIWWNGERFDYNCVR